MKKRCPKCKTTKNYNEFHKDKNKKAGLGAYCKECNIKLSNYYENTYKTRNQRMLKHYGITLEEYNQMVKDQDNKCAICKKPETKHAKNGKIKRLAIDHDHETGKIRGLLCISCNSGIGLLKEDIQIIKNVLKYLSI